MAKKTLKERKPNCYAMDISPFAGTKLTEKQVMYMQKLVEYADKNGYRITHAVFAPED